jgi:hypothetical protein
MSPSLSARRPLFRNARLAGAAVILAAAATLSACDINITDQAEGRSEWKKDYTLAAGGSLEIKNTNGLIEVDPSDGDRVSVTAERIAKAGTDEAAKKAAEEIEIQETVTGSSIVLDAAIHRPTINIGGGSRQVKFHVRAPKGTRLTLSNTNGEIQVRDMTGELRLGTTNGRILGKNLEGNTRAETTNGVISLDYSAIGTDGITAETTNGKVDITLAKSIKARVNARVTNGAISAADLPLEITEQSRRRLTATMNGGGPEIRVETTNGGVSLRAK